MRTKLARMALEGVSAVLYLAFVLRKVDLGSEGEETPSRCMRWERIKYGEGSLRGGYLW